MVDKKNVTDALRTVEDPELGRSLVDLGMIQNVETEGSTVRFTLALTTMACPLKNRMMDDARAAVSALEGVETVEIELAEMTDAQKQRVMGQAAKPQRGAAEHLNQIDRVIAVMSGKGGVGKSSVAAMLAVALQRQGKEVGVLDADITGPSIPKMFGLEANPMGGPVGILPPQTENGVKIMSINLLLADKNQAVVWRGPLISGAIKQFWGDVVWGDLDALVVDLPPGTSDASLTVMQAMPINGVVLVTSPQSLAGMVVQKAAQMAIKMDVPIVGLVENMSYTVCPHCGERIDVFGPSQAAEVAQSLDLPLMGQLPLDPKLAPLADAGKIEQYEAEPFEPVAEAIWERLSDQPSEPTV